MFFHMHTALPIHAYVHLGASRVGRLSRCLGGTLKLSCYCCSVLCNVYNGVFDIQIRFSKQHFILNMINVKHLFKTP